MAVEPSAPAHDAGTGALRDNEPRPPDPAKQGGEPGVETPTDAQSGDLPPTIAPPKSPTVRAMFAVAGALVVVGVLEIPILRHSWDAPSKGSASMSGSASGAGSRSVVASASTSASASLLVDPDAGPAPFRVVRLEVDPAFEVVQVKVGRRTCEAALTALGIAREEIARVAKAMAPVRNLSCRPSDRLFVAMRRNPTAQSRARVVAFELETAPGELVRVRERSIGAPAVAAVAAGTPVGAQPPSNAAGAGDELIAEQISLPVAEHRHAASFAVVDDLWAAVAAAGLDASIIDPLDEALGSRADVPVPGRGSVFRVLAEAIFVAGRFDRYDELVAIEYRPKPDAKPLRLYHLKDPRHGIGSWYDARGKQPLRGRWRMPLAFARISSRFNPRRMHPILHLVTPHEGCDFAAPSGTPVYSIGAGVVSTVGEAGPSGNLVTVAHDRGLESGYAHLSRFEPGIVPGMHVEAHALLGYVGTTGRSTAPHLHLSLKRNGVFVDPLSLKLDAVRVVPPSERPTFARRREESNAALDAIPLAVAPEFESPVSASAGSSGAGYRSPTSAPAGSMNGEGQAEEAPADDHGQP